MPVMLNARIIGLAVGALAGLLFVLLGWQSFLILLGFALVGLLIGFWLDATPSALRKLREAFLRLFSN